MLKSRKLDQAVSSCTCGSVLNSHAVDREACADGRVLDPPSFVFSTRYVLGGVEDVVCNIFSSIAGARKDIHEVIASVRNRIKLGGNLICFCRSKLKKITKWMISLFA